VKHAVISLCINKQEIPQTACRKGWNSSCFRIKQVTLVILFRNFVFLQKVLRKFLIKQGCAFQLADKKANNEWFSWEILWSITSLNALIYCWRQEYLLFILTPLTCCSRALSLGFTKLVMCIENYQSGYERLCMSLWILHFNLQKKFNENQSEMLDSPVVNARTTIEICFIFQGLQRLFIQKSHSFFYSKERWKHSGSLLAVSFRTFVSLTFVSESSLIEGGFHASWITFALRECLM